MSNDSWFSDAMRKTVICPVGVADNDRETSLYHVINPCAYFIVQA